MRGISSPSSNCSRSTVSIQRAIGEGRFKVEPSLHQSFGNRNFSPYSRCLSQAGAPTRSPKSFSRGGDETTPTQGSERHMLHTSSPTHDSISEPDLLDPARFRLAPEYFIATSKRCHCLPTARSDFGVKV